MAFENVHKGWCKFKIEEVVRCDCAPYHPKVGCCDAEVTCRRKGAEYDSTGTTISRNM
jgi:hypothetical protein